MKRLSLIIADTDEEYVDALCAFIGKKQPMRFDVKGFTGEEQLSRYLSGAKSHFDILLVNPDFNYRTLPLEKVRVLIFLQDGRGEGESHPSYWVGKYQHGDKLVDEIIEKYVQGCGEQISPAGGALKTEVFSIFSPVGGSGKTSIAAGLSKCSAQKGKKVFYLNLEDYASTSMFFHFEPSKSFSNVLYYLREKSENMAAKIEGCRSIDPVDGIYFFTPPESLSELYEAEPEELRQLVRLLKTSGMYDYVFIDMPSCFDKRAFSVLDESDIILLVASGDIGAEVKLKLFSKELEIMSKKRGIVLQDKINVVLNKAKESSGLDATLFDIFGRTPLIKIPEVMGMRSLTDVNSVFYAAINRLAGIICKSPT